MYKECAGGRGGGGAGGERNAENKVAYRRVSVGKN